MNLLKFLRYVMVMSAFHYMEYLVTALRYGVISVYISGIITTTSKIRLLTVYYKIFIV